MNKFLKLIPHCPSIALFPMRIVFGAIFFAHGLAKVMDTSLVVGYLESMSVPVPELVGVLVALIEFVLGIMIILGFWTRLSGALIALVMFFVLILVIGSKGFVGGYEFELLLFAIGISFALGAADNSHCSFMVKRLKKKKQQKKS